MLLARGGRHWFRSLFGPTQLALLQKGLVQLGDEVVILGGNAPLKGASNLMKIEIIDGKYS